MTDPSTEAAEPSPEVSGEVRRKRLLFRSWHRGTKETDMLLGSFAERHLADFTPAQLEIYEALLQENDANLFDWVAGRSTPPAEVDSDVLRQLMAFKYTPRSA
jgi:antitoxin CptB